MTRHNVEIEDKEEFERIEKEYQKRISEALDPIISELHNEDEKYADALINEIKEWIDREYV